MNPNNVTKPYYVILTGSKNNAGDYLIKYRAKLLLAELRTDREIIDIDGWKKFDENTLELVNGSEALILMGGPALQKNIYPGVYPLVDDLSKIKTKIMLMGVGWKNLNGKWENTHDFSLTESSKKLLARLASDGGRNSVRDYHTANVLFNNGVKNVLMTGCPATYSLEHLGSTLKIPTEYKKIGFSLGVSFLGSKKLEKQMKNSMLEIKSYFKDAQFQVVFHHSTEPDFLNTHNAKKFHLEGHLKFITWLDDNNIEYIDISGSAEKLINYYQSCDLHVGYRVHAHIFMTSISKPSILIAEDGRGKALRDVFGGVVLDAFSNADESIIGKIIRKLKLGVRFAVYPKQHIELMNHINYEISLGYPRVSASRKSVDNNWNIMKKFISQLP